MERESRRAVGDTIATWPLSTASALRSRRIKRLKQFTYRSPYATKTPKLPWCSACPSARPTSTSRYLHPFSRDLLLTPRRKFLHFTRAVVTTCSPPSHFMLFFAMRAGRITRASRIIPMSLFNLYRVRLANKQSSCVALCLSSYMPFLRYSHRIRDLNNPPQPKV